MFAVVALEASLNFTVPLYIQIVQGRTAIATAIAMMPFNLTVFFAAMLIVRLYGRLTPRQIGRYGFTLCAIALVWLAFVVRNNWNEWPVLLGLIIFGIGQGSLVTRERRRTAARHHTKSRFRRRNGHSRRIAGWPPERDCARQHRGEPEADARATGAGRSR